MNNQETIKKSNSKINVKSICFTGVMAALVFVFTFTFKIPSVTGYIHLGDCIIFLAIAILGTKKAAFAGSIGAALADLIGGYAIWIAPTFFIKLIMALICGYIAEKVIKNDILGFIVGAIAGGVFQICGYTIARVFLYDKTAALASLPGLTVQTCAGVVISVILITILNKTNAIKKLKKLAE